MRTCYIYPYNANAAAWFSPGVSFLDGIHYIMDNFNFSPEQIAELSEGVIQKIDEILSDESGTYSFFTAFFPYLLGAVISYHYDSTLTEEQTNILDDFVWAFNRSPVEESTLELIYESLGRIGA